MLKYSILGYIATLIGCQSPDPQHMGMMVEQNLRNNKVLIFRLIVTEETESRNGKITPATEAVTATVTMLSDKADIITYKNNIEVPVNSINSCYIGSCEKSWITGNHPERLREAISNSKFIGHDTVNGRKCMVMLWEERQSESETEDLLMQHKFYINPQDHFVYRWSTSQIQIEPETDLVLERITRVRTYEFVSIHAPWSGLYCTINKQERVII